ncbi:MAG: Rap1a/Tai family immunity protein [Gammaproteobacteria bacterium]
MLLAATAAHADTTAAQLADACARALAQNFVGLDAEACKWYVAPCPVCGPGASAAPGWCPPAGESDLTIAGKAIEGLRARPDAQQAPAKAAVKEVLERAYPCP